MKYTYSIDYQGLTNSGEVASRGFVNVTFQAPLTANDLDQFRKDYLKTLVKQWESNPMNLMGRKCPISAVGIVNVFGGQA